MKRNLARENLLYLLLSLVFLVVALVLVSFGYHIFTNEAENNLDPRILGTNASGLTYGIWEHCDYPERWPDLVRVEATNGEEGYAFMMELEEVSGTFMSADELLDRQILRLEDRARIFVGLLESELGVPTSELTDEYKFEIYKTARAMFGLKVQYDYGVMFPYPNEMISYVTEQAEIDMIQKLKYLGTADIEFEYLLNSAPYSVTMMMSLREHMERLDDEAQYINFMFVPVYDVEAKTVIGEFPIGW